jgi:hypothetical protein
MIDAERPGGWRPVPIIGRGVPGAHEEFFTSRSRLIHVMRLRYKQRTRFYHSKDEPVLKNDAPTSAGGW